MSHQGPVSRHGRVGVRAWLAAGVIAFGLGCRDRPDNGVVFPGPQSGGARPTEARTVSEPAPGAAPARSPHDPDADPDRRSPRPLRRCFDADLPWQDRQVHELLDQAAKFFDAHDPAGTLACAEEAARLAPRSIEAHLDRATALARLGRLEAARDAVTFVLAMAPNDTDALELAADLFINAFEPNAERTAIGLEYILRGQRLLRPRDSDRRGRFALLQAQALIDLGRARDALGPLQTALQIAPDRVEARYEQAVAFFELAQFDKAKTLLDEILTEHTDHAHAHFHMALVLERVDDFVSADHHMAEAARLNPGAFVIPPALSPDQFAERVRQVAAHLSEDARADLQDIPIETAEIPPLEDLIAEVPPLSPTIVGLFRGQPLGKTGTVHQVVIRSGRGRAIGTVARPPSRVDLAQYQAPDRAIVLYRRNLLRTIRSASEIDGVIRRTLLHEIGHLRGEDDGSLRDRGLE